MTSTTPSKGRSRAGGAARRRSPREFLRALGPGVVTGAADDDPSGIATYSIAGAGFGTRLLWTSLLTWPLMSAVQLMCARIGMVSGGGLTAALRKRFPRALILAGATLLLAANTINIGADLRGMSDAAEMLTGIRSSVFVVLFGIGIAWATIRLRYAQIASVLKWLAVVLFAYIVVAFRVGPDWGQVAHDALIPSWPASSKEFAALVAILGTTISPYLFFWQASQEIEEQKAMGRTTLESRKGATRKELATRRLDVRIGTLFSNLVMFFIILTAALTLHAHGKTDIQTSREAAEALTPLAGRFAGLLYTAGLIGTGLLAIPTLSGSSAYAFAETFGWRQGLDRPARSAKAFYGVIVTSTALGILMDFARWNAVKALFWSAVINGLLAPFLLLGILIVASDRKLMGNQPSSALSRALVGIAMLVMFAAAVGMFVF